MQAQVSLIIITAVAMAIGIATAQKTPRIPRNIYILWLCLTCVLILPAFFILKPLFFPSLDLSDPNPGEATLLEMVRLMGEHQLGQELSDEQVASIVACCLDAASARTAGETPWAL